MKSVGESLQLLTGSYSWWSWSRSEPWWHSERIWPHPYFLCLFGFCLCLFGFCWSWQNSYFQSNCCGFFSAIWQICSDVIRVFLKKLSSSAWTIAVFQHKKAYLQICLDLSVLHLFLSGALWEEVQCTARVVDGYSAITGAHRHKVIIFKSHGQDWLHFEICKILKFIIDHVIKYNQLKLVKTRFRIKIQDFWHQGKKRLFIWLEIVCKDWWWAALMSPWESKESAGFNSSGCNASNWAHLCNLWEYFELSV